MKKRLHTALLLSLVIGAVGMLARLWLLHSGLDQKLLLIPDHPAHFLCLMAMDLAVLVSVILLWDVAPKNRYQNRFPASALAAVGCMVLAVGIAITSFIQYGAAEDSPSRICALLGFAGAVALVASGICRYKGIVPTFLLHSLACVYFIALLLQQYRSWSGEPELGRYCFQLLTLIGLTVVQYHQAAFSAGLGKMRTLLTVSLITICLCCMAFPGSEHPFLYLSVLVYLVLSLVSVRLPSRMPREKEKSEEGA